MEAVQQKIASILSLDESTMTHLLEKLTSLGVAGIEDLQDVQLEDLTPEILLPVPARKLIRIFGESSLPAPQPMTPTIVSPPPPATSVTPLTSSPANWHLSFDVGKRISAMLLPHQPLQTQQAAKQLLDGIAISTAHRGELVRHLADDILKVCKTPSRAHLNVIAEKMVTVYSKLKDEIDGCVVGHGFTSIHNQLENRISYLKRPISAQRKSVPMKRRLEMDQEEKQTKTTVRDGYGCVDFLPLMFPDGETEDSLIDKQKQPQYMFSQHNHSNDDISSLMASTYILQRQD